MQTLLLTGFKSLCELKIQHHLLLHLWSTLVLSTKDLQI